MYVPRGDIFILVHYRLYFMTARDIYVLTNNVHFWALFISLFNGVLMTFARNSMIEMSLDQYSCHLNESFCLLMLFRLVLIFYN